ncbi:dephospho-CoA kinase domain-containing protein [Vombatus ursinus]|uniref:Dephospho-CoA kinase domain-containing protein n=1 Tax=Vombatus ursinus TaxID=29139 RepID=A0A4X2KHY1_VOMUR|nr:dephospho-CoA kinase domain-containing protein [Vombatus ursinus]XP_027728880.1 dephospho-CoA kinase domain-containing protein [Vombatus ursinus]XP_027728881.1 dephospho-CoA kinase domain-containing protein [Vombatus ursinus]
MFLVGLSGGIASGKSSVVQVFKDLGCAVIDADAIAHQVVKPGYPAYHRIVQAFGQEILLDNGEINRQALGNIIFCHSEKRKLLNAITHPDIRKEMLKQILKYLVQGYRYVILDIPLLFETKTMLPFMKHTVVVYCDPQTQLSRLMQRNGLSREEAEERIAAQLPLEEKRQLARHILDNSGEWEATRRQTLHLHSQLEDSLDFLPLRLGLFAGFVGIIYLLSRHLLL